MEKIQYPLIERIGNPDLFVGREEEFDYLNSWLDLIPQRLSKSKVILARRKSGKTSILQRIFNQLWSNPSRGIIPFYISLEENNVWLPEFASFYYRTFASHYISFFERNPKFVTEILTFEQIRDYGQNNSIDSFVTDIDLLNKFEANDQHGSMWRVAYSAPDKFASVYDQRILVIIDEFQYISKHIYLDSSFTRCYESMPGSYHGVVESKVAPMLVSGSYVGWMLNLMTDYLEAGRLSQYYISPYLKPDEGLQAVYKYAECYNCPISNEAAVQINQLCLSDAFFISCVIINSKKKNMRTSDDVIDAVNAELTSRFSMMSKTWAEYINKTVKKINDRYAKDILLHMSKHSDRTFTPEDLKNDLKIDLPVKKIHQRLEVMLESDLIEDGGSDIRYKGLSDGTLYLVLRRRFEEEISSHAPDFKSDFRKQIDALKQEKMSLQGRLSSLIGKFAEYQLATDMRSRKKFFLSVYFSAINYTKKLNIIDVKMRVKFQRPDGKEMEMDIIAESSCGRMVVIEVKKWKKPIGVQVVRDFIEKKDIYAKLTPKKKILPAILSIGGFTIHAKKLCQKKSIGMAESIAYL